MTPIYKVYPVEGMTNVYSTIDKTINIKFQSRSKYYVKFNWGHGSTLVGNLLTKLINDEYVPYIPILSRTKIYEEDEDIFKIDFYSYKGYLLNNTPYYNTNNNNSEIMHCHIIFHKCSNIQASNP